MIGNKAITSELCSKYMPSVEKLLARVEYVNGRVELKTTEGTTLNVVMLGEDP